MKITILSPVKHDGKDIAIGSSVDIPDEQAVILIESGAAEEASAAKKQKKDGE